MGVWYQAANWLDKISTSINIKDLGLTKSNSIDEPPHNSNCKNQIYMVAKSIKDRKNFFFSEAQAYLFACGKKAIIIK